MYLNLKPIHREVKVDELDFPEAKINQLKRKGLGTVTDILNYLPKEYFDYRFYINVKDLPDYDGEMVAFVGILRGMTTRGGKCLVLTFVDENSDTLSIPVFGQMWRQNTMEIGEEYLVCGKVTVNGFGKAEIKNPTLITENIMENSKIAPRYVKVRGMSDEYFTDVMKEALKYSDIYEDFDDKIRADFDIPSLKTALMNIHFPRGFDDLETLEKRYAFETLFKFLWLKEKQGIGLLTEVEKIDIDTNDFIKELPFTLTSDQLNVIHSIEEKIKNGERSMSLVEGDVGSGKTAVVFSLMFSLALKNAQSALIAPTQTLARQHFEEAVEYGEKLGVKVAFLTGDTKAKEKKEIIKGLKDGSIKIVIGTTSILNVEFKNLRLCVVDEEHRFGVRDREKLGKRSKEIHTINLSATPIPRSLALATESEGTEIYTIKTMPNGRKPVKTIVELNKLTVMEKMVEEVKKGHQAYVVCPLIEDGKLDAKNVVETAEMMQNFLITAGLSNIKVGYITGDMKQSNIDEEIEAFKNKEYQILVSTTIIEVGVNVPNTTFMLILSAERFGLATLHQLRGRVGRSSFESFCYLYPTESTHSKIDEKKRLKIMEETNSGFEISKKDLELRGPGELFGLKQSGQNEELEYIIKYPELVNKIKNYIKKEIVPNDLRVQRIERFLS